MKSMIIIAALLLGGCINTARCVTIPPTQPQYNKSMCYVVYETSKYGTQANEVN